MRKHFLILMLFALLPLAGWAAPVAYTDVTVTLGEFSHTYTGTKFDAPTVTVSGKAGSATTATTINAANYVLEWKYEGAVINPETDIKNAGTYTVEVKAKNEGDTFTPAAGKSLTQSFSVGKHTQPVVVRATATSITYGEDVPALNLLYQIDSKPDQFTTDGGVGTLGDPVVMPTFEDVNAGNKPFVLVAKSYVNYSVVVLVPNGSLSIAKKSITITTAPIAGEFTYGDAKPTGLTVVDYTAQLVGTDQLAGTLSFEFKKYVDPEETLIEGDLLPAGTYHVYPKGLSNDNYAITYAFATFTVGQKVLAPSMITAMPDSTYNGKKQAPTLALTDGTLPAPVYGTDYTAEWQYSLDNGSNWSAAPTGDNAFKPAALYRVTLSGTANGNYKTPAGTTAEPAATATYKINKKTLYIKTNNKEKTYDGLTPYAPAADADHLTFVGLETGDAAVYTGLTVSLGDGALAGSTKGVDADVYPINVSGTIGDLAANYTPQFGSLGKLTIKKRAITITPNTITKNYGADDDYVAGKRASAVAANAEDLAAGKVQVTTELAAVFATNESFTTLPLLKRNSGEAAGNYTLTPSAAVIKNNKGNADPADDVNVTKNYAITYTPGTFIIAKGGFTIWADDKSSVFGSETLETLTATVDGIPADDAKKIVFNEGAITTNATATSNRGVYTITIDKSKINFSAIEALYDIEKVVVVPGNYTITPKALKIKAKDQAHIVGQTVTEASLENIEFVTEGVSDADKAGVVGHITLAFSADAPVVPVTGTALADAAATSGYSGTTAAATAGVWVNGIKINVTAGAYWNTANYTLTGEGAETKAGTLYVTFDATPLALNRNTAAATADLQLAAINGKAGKIVTVTFTDDATKHQFKAQKWNTMVLPFDITVAEFSAKFGYAIVNTLNTTTTKYNEVHFTLNMGNIPANTPFIFKTADNTTINTKSFANVLIVKPEVATDDNKVGVQADGCTFYGTYGRAFLRPDNDKTWINDVLVTGANTDKTAANATYLYPYAAFLSLDDPNARIFVEDFENGVTAIKELNVETMKAYAVDGWYTLNGVKLQSVPTEKGVYINNGKKVVIK